MTRSDAYIEVWHIHVDSSAGGDVGCDKHAQAPT
eukprot:CAMPEP_0178456120 /NCGR_PEP_ID=MMETSP0689_2-20121128/46292_1 /TAXON_ID=160604 /ORGANISM="Amphidinium massartii, Strain CS-259" /LENGTH=33 /DNA_ID= /DNA_START= /DNA_END= /DNA_ORIENTATION=